MTSSAAEAISSATAITVELELVARRVDLTAPVGEGRDARDADGHVDDAGAERPAEGVADDHADVTSGSLADLLADGRGGSVGVDGQQHEGPRLGRVRRVDAGRGADEPMAGLRDHERRPRADDSRRLAEDHLEMASVVSGRKLDRRGGRLDVVEADDATLGLRHDLLRHDDDVGVHELERVGDELAEIVPFRDLGEAFDRDDS